MIMYNVADTVVAVLCALEIVDVIDSRVTDIAELIVCHATNICACSRIVIAEVVVCCAINVWELYECIPQN